MDENNNTPAIGLTDSERFPLIKDLTFLNRLKQDNYAPKFNFKSGDRLTENHLSEVNRYKKTITSVETFWESGKAPHWLDSYLEWCVKTVPAYIGNSGGIESFKTITRDNIRNSPWSFVSNEANLRELLTYQTSGTTGAKLDVLFDPVSQACWLPQMETVLKKLGVTIERGNDTVAIALICAQQKTLTYASLSTYLDGAGVLKINLNELDWKHKIHAVKYLEKYNPQVLTGDPIAFMALHALKPKLYPKAMISSAMTLTKGTKTILENYFKCPVIDVYSLTECRNIAFATPKGYQAIRPELYLEIFDQYTDKLLPLGEHGELVVTGGNNPFLPLIRYRTGDFCSLKMENGIPYLMNLEARKPVVFYTKTNRVINTIDISRELSYLSLAGFKMHQNSVNKVKFTGVGNEDIEEIVSKVLRKVFDNEIDLEVEILPISKDVSLGKSIFTSEIK